MAKSRIGPFALEAPLSKQTSSGRVFSAIHLEQKKSAAVRVFPIPMGMTPESREAFAGQLEQLKQLRHRNIARCYGGGFDTRNAFLAYELVDGESLSSILKRRDKLPWESALDYSKQIAEALQYAHQMGWIHGRLRPSKVMISPSGVVKLVDWRREAIASMLDEGPVRRVHLQYMAPESIDGTIDEKTDLYALGALMYTMLTGQPVFDAEQPQQLTELVKNEPAPSVSSQVLDCPVWLNAIISQLLAKDARSRPFSATALQLAFKEAQRRQEEGVGVLQHAASGFSPLQMNVDRDEAEKVLGIKPKKKRKKSSQESIFEKTWVLLLGLAMAVAAVVWFLMPLNEQTLRERGERLLASEEWTDWNEARDTYLHEIVERFPEGEHAVWAKEKTEWVDAREIERRMDRDERHGWQDNWSPAQIRYAEAREYERFGDLATAMDKFRAIVQLFRRREEDRAIVFLANEGLARIREKGLGENALQLFLTRKLTEAQTAYDQARIIEAKLIWESIIELYSQNQDVQPLVEQAQEGLDSLNKRR
ncbi:MAG: serine/threonine protein kinase [Planctomycetales bacterium]|nr:serine/threonine protein kinase [Planctomycetales bacterium]